MAETEGGRGDACAEAIEAVRGGMSQPTIRGRGKGKVEK